MIQIIKTCFFILYTIAVSIQVDAHLAAGIVASPEVIPGPGFPSLASLNLTSADLYNMDMPAPGKFKITQCRNLSKY